MTEDRRGFSPKKLFTLLTFCGLLLTGFSQGCPGFQPGSPSSPSYSLRFYDSGGHLITTCSCQLAAAFKCGGCLPSSFYFYEYTTASGTTTCANAIVLPVILSSFTATVSGNTVRLDWTTETEQNNKRFLLERSENGVDFALLTEIDGKGGHDSPASYSITDPLPGKGINYYLLSQKDIDGTVTPLQILTVELIPELTQVVLAPNPAKGIARLQLPLHGPEHTFNVTVADRFGKTLTAFDTTEDAELALPSGCYFVTVASGNQSWQEKLVILD